MNLHLSISVAVAVIGGIVYLVAPNKVGELGKLAFAAGVLAALLRGG